MNTQASCGHKHLCGQANITYLGPQCGVCHLAAKPGNHLHSRDLSYLLLVRYLLLQVIANESCYSKSHKLITEFQHSYPFKFLKANFSFIQQAVLVSLATNKEKQNSLLCHKEIKIIIKKEMGKKHKKEKS